MIGLFMMTIMMDIREKNSESLLMILMINSITAFKYT